MRAVNDAVQDSIAQGWIAEDSVMPQSLTGESLTSGWSTRTMRCMAAASQLSTDPQAAAPG